jgi:phosphomevalonate kinase
MDDHVKDKRKALAKIKKDFDLKMAFAKKKNEGEEAIEKLDKTKASELKRVTALMAEKSSQGKADIKEKFNELAKNKNIDTKELIKALYRVSESEESAKSPEKQSEKLDKLIAKLSATADEADKEEIGDVDVEINI